MPAISVVIPVYNVEKYLRRCLDSVAGQTFSDWEAICVNDGSPDNSAAILAEYAARDKRFKVITKENGGLSDARNVGTDAATGDYLIYLDSDDFIHPQTMEFSYALAQRDGSDIVSWYKDKFFRPQLLIWYKLGFDIDSMMPRRIKKRYKLEKIRTCVTDDVFAHTTERPNSSIKWPIKHFYVWRHLIRREFIKGIKFIKGITFEDFPWWSEVMLHHPRVTITKLPFLYYFPNLNSIDMASNEVKKVRNWIIGLESSYNMYRARATDYEKIAWEREVMWPVIVYQIFRKVRYIKKSADAEFIKETLLRFKEMGMFDNPQTWRAKIYQRRILKYINQ
ncbi:MAG: glycosyltransferase [Rickettsiales bacterium]|jgi:glycosyltransferase involved in cell wall biosynthesis|nr:glycosyltransferase [Rickettsiales bacterium]